MNNQLITTNAGTLYDLVSGATIAADSSRNALDKLAAVYLTAESGKLTAAATDRYRLIAGTIELEGGELSHSAITLPDIKRLISLIKPYAKGSHPVTISKEGYTLTITLNGDTLTINSPDYQFPPYSHLVSDDYSPVSSVALNLNLLATFAKVPHDIKQPTILGFTTGENKPVQIKLAHDLIKWDILLMPMRNNRA